MIALRSLLLGTVGSLRSWPPVFGPIVHATRLMVNQVNTAVSRAEMVFHAFVHIIRLDAIPRSLALDTSALVTHTMVQLAPIAASPADSALDVLIPIIVVSNDAQSQCLISFLIPDCTCINVTVKPRGSPRSLWNSSWPRLLPLPRQSRQRAFTNTAIFLPQGTPICTQQASVTSALATPPKSVLLAMVHAMQATLKIPMTHAMTTPPTVMPAIIECFLWPFPGTLSLTLSTPPGIDHLISPLRISVQASSIEMPVPFPALNSRSPDLISIQVPLFPIGNSALLVVLFNSCTAILYAGHSSQP